MRNGWLVRMTEEETKSTGEESVEKKEEGEEQVEKEREEGEANEDKKDTVEGSVIPKNTDSDANTEVSMKTEVKPGEQSDPSITETVGSKRPLEAVGESDGLNGNKSPMKTKDWKKLKVEGDPNSSMKVEMEVDRTEDKKDDSLSEKDIDEVLRIGVVKKIMALDVETNIFLEDLQEGKDDEEHDAGKGFVETPMSCSNDALFLISKSSELFLHKFIKLVLQNNPSIVKNEKKNIIKYGEIMNTSRKHKELKFLYDLLPEI